MKTSIVRNGERYSGVDIEPDGIVFLTPSIRAAAYSGGMRKAETPVVVGRVSLASVLVCVGIVLMAVVRQYLSGQY